MGILKRYIDNVLAFNLSINKESIDYELKLPGCPLKSKYLVNNVEAFNYYNPELSSMNNELIIFDMFCKFNQLKVKGYYKSWMLMNTDHQIIEVYDVNKIQVYRSHTFMKFKTYTWNELAEHSNFELYVRDEQYMDQIMQVVERARAEETLVEFNVPTHIMWERHGSKEHHFVQKLGCCVPVYDNKDEIFGVMIIHNTKQVFSSPPL